MEPELNLDEIEKEASQKAAVEKRFKETLAHKAAAEEKAEAEAKARAEAESKLASMERDMKFLDSFSTISTKFPGATEYKDKIKEKVAAGYSVDDATVAILHAEGKLTAPQAPRENVAGGSAPNQITGQPQKQFSEMNSSEKWDVLREIERKGDIFQS